MTHILKLTLCAALALTPTLSSAQTLIQRGGGGDPAPRGLTATPAQVQRGALGLTTTAGGATAGDTDDGTFCGNADVFYWYEEDANGNEVPGTRQWGCTD